MILVSQCANTEKAHPLTSLLCAIKFDDNAKIITFILVILAFIIFVLLAMSFILPRFINKSQPVKPTQVQINVE